MRDTVLEWLICIFVIENGQASLCLLVKLNKKIHTAWRTSDEKIKYITSTIQKTTSIKMNCKLY